MSEASGLARRGTLRPGKSAGTGATGIPCGVRALLTSVRRHLEALAAHGVLEKARWDPEAWTVSEWTREQWGAVR
jgi:hypothetical protein